MEMNLKFSPFGERTNVFSKPKQGQGSTIDDQSFNSGIEFFVTFELPGVWVVPPPRMPVANEGLGWDPLVKMFHNPGGDSYWEGGQPNLVQNDSLAIWRNMPLK